MAVLEVGLLFTFSGDLSETSAGLMAVDHKTIKILYLLNDSTYILPDDPPPLWFWLSARNFSRGLERHLWTRYYILD